VTAIPVPSIDILGKALVRQKNHKEKEEVPKRVQSEGFDIKVPNRSH
jgi:hypothetical protein